MLLVMLLLVEPWAAVAAVYQVDWDSIHFRPDPATGAGRRRAVAIIKITDQNILRL